ncbi:MAG: Rieske 2Fe-2S domain-containing protein [Burkholderiaceae bacterium]
MTTDAQPVHVSWPRRDFTRVPYRVFADQTIYEREQSAIFRGAVWCYLALEAELPRPGDFRATVVGDTPVIVNRAADGAIHAFVNRCAHRGAIVRRETHGNASDHRCVYHQWCFDLTGKLVGIPFRRGVKGSGGGYDRDFDPANHGLTTLRVATYKGLIFGTLHPDTEALETWLDDAVRGFLDRTLTGPLRVLGYARQRISANWKLYLENVGDPYHAGLLHLFHQTFGTYRPTQLGGVTVSADRGHMVVHARSGDYDKQTADGEMRREGSQKFQQDMTLEDQQMLQWRVEYEDGVGNMIMRLFPSVVVQQIYNTLATRHIRPVGPGEFELRFTFFGFESDDPALDRLRRLQANLAGPAGYISMEDGEATELVQRGIVRDLDAHSVVEMGGKGPIETAEYLVTEVPLRGLWKRYTELMGHWVGPAGGDA